MKNNLPAQFIEMLHDLLGDEAFDLIKALDDKPVTSVRLNRRKPGADFPEGERVAWCESGLYLNERPEFILDPLLHAGAYYVQDASSMIYETVVDSLVKKFSNRGTGVIRVLDMCAAPGGKTTAMINALPDGSEVTANEYTSKRIPALKENIDRWGYSNVTITNKDSHYYALQGENFDIVAVDAPCSGEGMMRKEEIARSQWSMDLIKNCATLQKEILNNAVQALKPGGFLIYSTCTFNRWENEENAQYIKESLGLEPIDMSFPKEWRIEGGIKTKLPVYRFMPHKTRGEGLFLAVFRKPGEWKESVEFKLKDGNFKMNNKESLPTVDVDKESLPTVDVDKETALAYLRRESIILPEGSPRGLVTITYKGLPLGEAKNIGSRANNLYPKNRRILKR